MLRRSLVATATTALVASLVAVIPAVVPTATAAPDSVPPQEQHSATSLQPFSAPGIRRGPEVVLGTKQGREKYTVQLTTPAVPERDLGVSVQRIPTASAHRRALRNEQTDVSSTMAGTLGRDVPIVHRFTEALNGFTVSLTATEARQIAQLDDVTSVHVDTISKPLTSHSFETIGAPAHWTGEDITEGIDSHGEGVIVGIIDSGLNWANPAFAATVPPDKGGDGYVHQNPYGAGNFKGMCAAGSPQHNPQFQCNDKLIGAYDYTDASEGLFSRTAHGTHVAATAAGNQLDVAHFTSEPSQTVRGVAPHANIISYDVCVEYCSESSTVAAVEQAIKDGVDVLNHSIGGTSSSASWHTPYAVAFRNARAAGIDVAQAAGNEGPYASTVGRPADLPWVTSVGALENGRIRTNQLLGIEVSGMAPEDGTFDTTVINGIAGTGASQGTGSTKRVIRDGEQCAGEPTEVFTGALVICERAVGDEADQSYWVEDAEGAGVIFVDAGPGVPPVKSSQGHPISVTFVGDQADELRGLLDRFTARARIGATSISDATNRDEVASFSSRGPNPLASTLAPHLSAPGSLIYAAAGNNNAVSFNHLSGTSMASPHVAGAYALLAAVHPEWTPAEAQSALMSTADSSMKALGKAATLFEQGSGRIDVSKAAQAGLLADETTTGYATADPDMGGNEQSINSASFVDDSCPRSCEFSVDLRATAIGAGSWAVTTTTDATGGFSLSAPAVFDASATAERTLTVAAEFSGSDDNWHFGSITLTPPPESDASPMRIPVAARQSAVDVPAGMTLRTSRSEGSMVHTSSFANDEAAAASTVTVSGMAPQSEATSGTVQKALDTGNPFTSSLSLQEVTVPQGTTRAVIELDSEAPDLDLFVWRGSPTPPEDQTNLICAAEFLGSRETCDLGVEAPTGHTYWVGVHAYELDYGASRADYDLRVSTVSQDDTTLTGTTVVEGSTLKTTLTWDDDRIKLGEIWFGMVQTEVPGQDEPFYTPITIGRTGTDVTRTSSSSTATWGELMTHTVSFTPTRSMVDETYTFEELVPLGARVVEVLTTPAPITSDGRKSSWSVTVPAGETPTYSYSYTSEVSDTTLTDGSALTFTATHRRSGGPARTTAHTVTVSVPEPVKAEPLVSAGEGVREVSVVLERGWSLTLLDGSAAVFRVPVDGGEYSVEPGGVLRYTPDAGRHGTPAPARYRVTDALGNHASSTFSPTVWTPAPSHQDKSTRGGSEQRVTVTISAGQSLALLAAGAPVSALTTDHGTFRIDGNAIAFAATQGVTGTIAPIRFRVSDAHGRYADSTWSLIVDPIEASTKPTQAPTAQPTQPAGEPTPQPTSQPTQRPTPQPTPQPKLKVNTTLTVTLTKKTQKARSAKPAKARITVKASKRQAKGKIVIRINGKVAKTIRVTKNRTFTFTFPKKLSRGTKNIRVTFEATASGPSASATRRTTLRVVR